MRIYKQRKGEKAYRKWTVEFFDHLQTRRKLQGFTDKDATAALGHKLEKLVAFRASRRALDAELSEWVEGLPPRMLKRLAAIGLLDEETTAPNDSVRQAAHGGEKAQTEAIRLRSLRCDRRASG